LEKERLGKEWYGTLARRCRVWKGKTESWNPVEGAEEMEKRSLRRDSFLGATEGGILSSQSDPDLDRFIQPYGSRRHERVRA